MKPFRKSRRVFSAFEHLECRRLLTSASILLAHPPHAAAQLAPSATSVSPSIAANVLSGPTSLPTSYAFVHPCLPDTLADLNTIKANLAQEPFKSGYAILSADAHSQLTYKMQGPFTTVSRTPDVNLGQWENDMVAVYNLARMWVFTGNTAYAQKAHDILLAWATTETSFGGQEGPLAMGDTALAFGGGAEILRGTWSGWTATDTATVKNYFENVLWPSSGCAPEVLGPANKGAIYMEAGITIAIFCDDAEKFNHVINLFLNDPASGLRNTLPTGEMGETGRDEGHSYGNLNGLAYVAAAAWNQGVDLYSAMDNRLLACAEYYARNTLKTDNPFVPFGTIDATYFANNPYSYTANRQAFYILQNAYKNRLGLPTPWMDRKLAQQPVDGNNWMYARTADFSHANPVAIDSPAVSLASGGLTLTTLGSQTAGRSGSYSNGVWTLSGLGNDVWNDTTDDAQFDYHTMIGDGAIVARVTSSQVVNAKTKAGLMIRDNLTADVSQRAWIGITNGNLLESHLRGWTLGQIWGGSNRDDRSSTLPPGIPYWLKVERQGNFITTYSSLDGTSWAAELHAYYANLPSTVYMGLFVCSGSTSTPTTATFDHVAFTGGTGGLVTTPAAPASVFAAGSSKAVTVRWLPSFGATGYDLLRSTTSGGGYTVIASNLSTSKTSYVDTAVTAGTTYYYVVRAKNAAGTSGNSPEYGDSLVPLSMSNLAFSGTATASYSNSNPLEVPSEAFDSDPGSKWFDSAAPTGWLQEDFGANNAQIVKRYTINSADVATRDPKDWTLLGSQDGVNWTTLDSQTGQLFDYRMQQKTYDIANTTAYRYYRLNVTANNGATGLAIAELGLWSDTGRTLADGRYRLVSRRSNKVMGVDGGATSSGAQLSQSDWTGSDSQQWDLVWQGNGQYRATSVASGKVIDNGGTSNTGAVLNIQPWSGGSRQLWQVLPDSDGFYRFKSVNSGLVADVSGGSTASGAKIIQWTSSGSDNQQWMFSIGSAPQPAAAAPSSLSATPDSISTINLAWTASPGAVSYNVKRATSSGGPFATIATGTNTPSYQDTYLTPNTTYYYVVSPVNGTGEGADSAPASATTPAGAPAAPAGVSAKAGTGQVILNWTVTGGATSYTLKRATVSSGPYTTVASNLVGTTFTDTGLTNGVTYYYVLAAINTYGQSPDSGEVHVMPSDLAVRLKFDEGAQTTAYDATGNGWNGTLVNGPTWSSSGKMNGAVTLDGTDEFVSLPAGVVNGLTAITLSAWINLANVTTWQRVFDFGTGTNNSMFLTTQYSTANGSSNRLRFTIRTPSVAEQQINSSVATPIGTWAHVVITLAGGVGTMYLNGEQVGQNNAMTLTPASLGTTTLDYIGKSESSSDPYLSGSIDDFRIYSRALTPAEAKTLATQTAPPAPTSLAATAGNAQVALTWAAAANAATYTVKRAAVSGGPYVALATGLAGTSFTDTSVTNDTPYYYVVSATNLVDTGADSAQAAATPSLPPTLSSFDVNDGSAQRSMVTSLKLAFSQPVTLGSGAISLLKNGAPADGVTVTASAGPSNQYVLTFSGSSVVGGSLADGSYSLVLSGAAVTNASNISMASDASFNFKRLFGDIKGNGVVNGIDYGAFQAAYGSTTGSPAYVSAFDYDNNGAVSGIDYGQFRTRYGIAL